MLSCWKPSNSLPLHLEVIITRAYKASRDLSYDNFSILISYHAPPMPTAIQPRWLLSAFQQARLIPASGAGHLLLPLPGMFFLRCSFQTLRLSAWNSPSQSFSSHQVLLAGIWQAMREVHKNNSLQALNGSQRRATIHEKKDAQQGELYIVPGTFSKPWFREIDPMLSMVVLLSGIRDWGSGMLWQLGFVGQSNRERWAAEKKSRHCPRNTLGSLAESYGVPHSVRLRPSREQQLGDQLLERFWRSHTATKIAKFWCSRSGESLVNALGTQLIPLKGHALETRTTLEE